MLSLVAVVAPQLALAQTPRAGTSLSSSGNCATMADNGITGVVNCLVDIFNVAIYLMIAAAVVYIVYGAFNMIRSEEKREEGKQTIYYGIVGLFVMISIWGLVNILDNTFRLSDKDSDAVINKAFIK